MRRMSLLLVPLLALLGGCDFWKHADHFSTYCDATGCYQCDQNGCRPYGGGTTGNQNQCQSNADCAAGCYCDTATGVCNEGGYCQSNQDCSTGFTCDTGRQSCEPIGDGGTTDGGPNSGCTSNDQCAAGLYCNTATSQCLPSWKCTTQSDCGGGMVCDSRNTCVPGPTTCTLNASCAPGCYCNAGSCTETSLCTQNSDCTAFGSNFVCVNNTCEPPVAPSSTPTPQPSTSPNPSPTACVCSTDCPSGDVCVNGACQTAPLPVNACQFNSQCGTGRCDNAQCQAACTTSATCGTGLVCTGGFCQPPPATQNGGGQCTYNSDCSGTQTCINGYCHADCTANTDCSNPADSCQSGLCQPSTALTAQCHTNNDCTSGQECVNAVCRVSCFTSTDCSSCASTPICNMGFCYAQSELTPQCQLSSSCGANQSCINASCQ